MKNSKIVKLLFVFMLVFFLTGCIFNPKKETIKYQISFDTDGGTIISNQMVEEGKYITKPSDPVKKGYHFIEWTYLDKSYSFSSPVYSNITLKAKYIEANEEIEEFTVKFDTDGGNTISNQIIKKDEKIKQPENPIKDGYKFVEWQLDGKKYDFETKVTKNIELKAIWEKEIKKYTVRFDTDGGSSISNQTVVEGKKVSKPNNPTKDNYGFIEWQLNGKTYDFNSVVKGNITLKAVWKKYEKYSKNLFAMNCGSIDQKYLNKGDNIDCQIEFETPGDLIKSFKLDVNYGKGLKLISFTDKTNKVENNNNTYAFNLNKATSVGFIGLWKFEVVDVSSENELYVSLDNKSFETTNNGFYYSDNTKSQLKSIWSVPNSEYSKYNANVIGLELCYIKDPVTNSLKKVEYLSVGDEITCYTEFETGGDVVSNIKYTINYGSGLTLISHDDYSHMVAKDGNDYKITLNTPTVYATIQGFVFKVNDISNIDELYVEAKNIKFITKDKKFYYVDDSKRQLN